jgi:hypothetical protein
MIPVNMYSLFPRVWWLAIAVDAVKADYRRSAAHLRNNLQPAHGGRLLPY